MSIVGQEPFEALCRRSGIPVPLDARRIRAGRNSEVWRVSNAEGQWILKRYYHDRTRTLQRLATEFGFLTFLSSIGVRSVALPLGCDSGADIALYSFLPGARPTTIAATHIRLAAAFVAEINDHRRAADSSELPSASEACFSIRHHLDLTGVRLSRWRVDTRGQGVLREADEFMRQRVWPCWERIRDRLVGRLTTLERELPPAERILSPSDFGFHNTLEADDRLSFLDFEYAGWDDPAKLICDFICQPELPVTDEQGALFAAELLPHIPASDDVARRVADLLPVHRLKWICILLNEFRAEDRLRRAHAGVDATDILTRQLDKATLYFDAHLARVHEEGQWHT